MTWVRFLHGVPRGYSEMVSRCVWDAAAGVRFPLPARVNVMPFRSKKQRAYMYAKHPGIARRWAKKYGNKIRPKKKKK